MIRKFNDNDFAYAEENYPFNTLEIRYHGDVIKDNIFVCCDENGNTAGILYFKYNFSWFGANSEFNRIEPVICCEEDDIYVLLLEYAKEWITSQKELCKDKRACLSLWLDCTDTADVQLHLRHGFYENNICPCLRFDLDKEPEQYPIPDGMSISRLPFEPESVNAFIEATGEANFGARDSINELWFMTGEGTYAVYVIKDGDRIVSSASTWRITDERAAIENIFVSPAYRRKGMGRAVIMYTLNEIRKNGYKYATLSMVGRNVAAGRLYQSLGFELMFNQVELAYPADAPQCRNVY